MTSLAFTRQGTGAPLLLLHGIGASHHAWDPVVPVLAQTFDVVAVDLPGFGDSDPFPDDVEPHPAALAAAVASFLDEQGISAPHVAGNSLGGWIALELAAIRPVASVALLSPAGLWRNGSPLYARTSVRAIRWLSRHLGAPLSHVVRYRLGRILTLPQIYGRPVRVDPAYARTAIRDMGTCPGFDATMRASEVRRYEPLPVDAPVTVAFGSRDFILLERQSRDIDRLPPGTHVGSLPRCGHVPMADHPTAVTDLITTATTHALPERPPT